MTRLVTALLVAVLVGATLPRFSHAQAPDPDVRSRLHLAEELVREKRYDEALELYREIGRARPDDPRILAGTKTCLLELKQYDELSRILQSEHERWPDDPATLEQLGTSAARQGNRAEAARWWRKILDVQGRSRGSFELVADLFGRNRMLDEAMATYAEGDSLHRGDFTRQKAALHELRLEFDAATREYLRYLESNPTALSFVEGKLLRIGEAEGSLGPVIERVEAQAQAHDAKRALAEGPERPLPEPRSRRKGPPGWEGSEIEEIFYRKLLADLHLEAGDHAGAAKEYIRLTEASPSQMGALLVFGKRCQTDGAYDVAIDVFEFILQEKPDVRSVPSALTEIARCQVALRRWDDALATYARLEQEYPETSWALSARFERAGLLLRGKGKPEEAEAIYRELLPIPSGPWKEADPQFGVAECALWKSDFDRARGILAAFRERELSPETLERALFEEGSVNLYAGDFATADSLFKRVAQTFPKGAHVNDALQYSILVNTNPDAPEILARYGSALHRLRTGRAAEALEILQALERESPTASIADEALLLSGHAWRAQGRAQDAIAACERAVAKAQVPDLAAEARFLAADVLAHDLHDTAGAIAQYEELLVSYPETLAADRARHETAALRRALP